jgi:hypothetical protein
MILLEIEAQSVAVLEFECDAPWSIDMNSIADRLAAKPMKIKPRDIHIIRTAGAIESVEPALATLVQCALDARCRPRL